MGFFAPKSTLFKTRERRRRIRELETHGYLVRARVRNENGQLGSIEYTILEQPKEPAQTPAPIREKPIRENPIQVKPMLDVS